MLFFAIGGFLGIIITADIQFFTTRIAFDLWKPLFDKLDIAGVINGYLVVGYKLELVVF